jgi:hypothetical protein
MISVFFRFSILSSRLSQVIINIHFSFVFDLYALPSESGHVLSFYTFVLRDLVDRGKVTSMAS